MNKKKMMLVSALLFLLLLLVLLFPIGATSESDNAADVVIDLAMPEDNVIVSDPIQIEVEISEEDSTEEDTMIDVFIEEPSADDEIIVEEIVIPDESEPELDTPIEIELPGEQPTAPLETTEEHALPDSAQMYAEIGDFVFATTQTRVYMTVDDTACDDYDGDYLLGRFLNDATVQVESVEQDILGRTWYMVSYLYGPDEGDGLFSPVTNSVYVLADETLPTDRTALDATDYGYTGGFAMPMLLASSYFSLRDNYGGVTSFYAGESGLHATTGHDNEYLQIARHDEYGTIFATPHYLKGEIAYCLENTMNSPVVRDHASGPYTIVDLDGYKVTPGFSGYIFSDKTMHALAWVH